MTPRTLRNWIYLGLLSAIVLAMACQCWATAPSFSVHFIAPDAASRLSPCPVFAYIEMGRRCWPIAGGATADPGITWTNSSGSEYVMDVSIISLSTSGSGTPRNIRVKTGESFNWGSLGGDDQYLTEGTVGSLAAGEYGVSGGNLYVRLADDADPGTKGAGGSGGYLQLEFDVADFGNSDTSNLGGSGWTLEAGSEYSYDTALFSLDPAITGIIHVSEGAGLSNAELTRGTAGSLAAGEFDIVDDKVHIRLSDSSNPNSAGASDITIYAEYTGDQCECLPRFYGTAVDAMPDWARYTNDPRPRLNNRQIDVTGNDTTNLNRPHGFNWGILAFEGSVTAEWTVTNPNGDSTTQTAGPITIAANSRTSYTVGSGKDYATLAAAFAALGADGSVPTADIELTVDDGHTENIGTGEWFELMLDNWYVHRADTGGTIPILTYNGSPTGAAGAFFDARGSEHAVVYGFQVRDTSGGPEDDTISNNIYTMGALCATIELSSYGETEDAVTNSGFVPPDSDPKPWEGGNGRGYLGLNCRAHATKDCTIISAAGWSGLEQACVLGCYGGPSNGENVYRFTTNEHYLAFGWTEATESDYAEDVPSQLWKTTFRFSGCHFTTRYGCYNNYPADQDPGGGAITGRVNQNRGTGSYVQRFEAEFTPNDSITHKESSYDVTFTDSIVDARDDYGFMSSIFAAPSGQPIRQRFLHNTGVNLRSYGFFSTIGDTNNYITYGGNLCLLGANEQVDFIRFPIGKSVVAGNVYSDDTPSTTFVEVMSGGAVDSTLADTAALNAVSWASGNTLDADLSFDADYISNGPVTVTTMPGSYSDYYGNARGSTSWAGAVGSTPPSESQGLYNTFIPGVLIQQAP